MYRQACQIAAAVLWLSSIAPAQVLGQTRWLPPRNYDSVVLEIMKPNLELDGVSFLSSASVATAQFAVGQERRHFLTVDIPFAHIGIDGDESETAIGNPYVGISIFDASNPVIYEFGGRIPIASNNFAALIATLVDFDRFEAYAPESASVSAALHYFPSRSGDWVLQTRLGPTVLLDLDPGEFDATADLFANYSLQTWYYSGAFQLGMGISGRLLITDDASLAERIVHQAAVSVQYDFRSLIPGVHVRLPLDDDLSDAVDLVYGVNVTIPLAVGG